MRARLAAEPGVVDVDDVREAAQRKLTFVDRQGEGGPERRHHRADRRHASGRAGGRHGGRGAERHGAQPAADRAAAARGSADQRGRPGEGAGQGQQRPTGAAGRTGPVGDGPRGPDDLPQEPPARGLRVRRDGRPAAGRRGRGRAGRQSEHRQAAQREVKTVSATAGWPTEAPRPVAERTFFSNGSGHRLGRARRLHRRLRRRGRVEDHARRLPRPRAGLRRGDDRASTSCWWPRPARSPSRWSSCWRSR